MQDVAPTTYDFDFFVIGAGSGGVRAARIAARAGARVAITEESRVGGTCVIRGCIPKKLLVYASHFAHDFEDSHNYGWSVEVKGFHWKTLIDNKNTEIDRLNGIYKNLLSGSGVKLLEGRGTLVDAHTVKVGDATYTSDKILIATGSWPWLPSIPGIEHAITSNEALDLQELPKHVVIVGAGYIACEFATIFIGCGAQVTQIFRKELVLTDFDHDVQLAVMEESQKQGIKYLPSTQVTAIEKTSAGLTCHLDNGQSITCDVVMYATGRVPKTVGLGLESVGVKMDEKGAIVVDEWSCTSVPNIYAVGDVTNRINLTPVALAEGHALADTLYNKIPRKPDHTNVPSAVFTLPPVACVGYTEQAARKHFSGGIDVYFSKFTPLKYTVSKRSQKSVMKLIVDRETNRVVGAHMVGDDAPEIIQGVAIAVKCGATKAQFDSTVGIHPSAAEEFVTMRTKRE